MIDDRDRAKRMEIVERIAVGMAERNNDPILAKTKIISESSFQGNPKSEEELDSQKPIATQADGGRYFTHVRMDGRGQIDIVWPSGIEKVFKFWIPEEYLTASRDDKALAMHSDMSNPSKETEECNQGTELENALKRMRKVDPRVPMSLGNIPGFPFTDFRDMQRAIQSGKFAIARFSFHQEPTILELISPRSHMVYVASMFATYLVPIAMVILAFTVSHWFWLGLLYFFVGARITISIWKKSILEAAHHSESAFCLLFYTSKINAYDLTTSTEYEWQQLTTSE